MLEFGLRRFGGMDVVGSETGDLECRLWRAREQDEEEGW